MTNHSENTGSPENGDITGRDGLDGRDGCGGLDGRDVHDGRDGRDTRDGWGVQVGRDGQVGSTGGPSREGQPTTSGHTAYVSHARYDGNAEYGASPAAHQVTLRTPGELADALPYLLGYRPEDSIVLVALHDLGGRGRFGGRARLGIPANPDDWGAVAQQLAQGLVKGSERRGDRPAQMVAYLCQEPARGETGRQVMERLQSLAHQLRLECGNLDIPVIEALCISDGRFWSYCCGGKGCCPVEGVPMGLPGTSVLAAAATYAGIQVRGTLRELRARLLPLETGAAVEQEIALDTAGMALVPRIVDETSRSAVAQETLDLAGRVMRRFAEAPVVTGVLIADHRDDELLGFDEAAALILGLQDRVTRDRAAEWMEGDEAAPALRLWRALARRCVGPYSEHAAAPLTLAGWVAWSSGDELEAREALAVALGADPGYLFARLLHQACNEGLDPESVRRCLRTEREGRERHTAAQGPGSPTTPEGSKGAEGAEGTGGTDAPANPGEAKDANRPGEGPGEVTDTPDSGQHGSAACAEAGQEPEPQRRSSGTNALRSRTPRTHTTRPVAPSRGVSRPRSAPRSAGKASPWRRGNRAEGARPDGDDATGQA
ncbi:protein of unknown function [Streptomyces sp. yr375]|uniref:DUF4192 domain-containing protein n=1 Tax=Streptomyces sp. yr375 TaxID=1761906 RepID=UPI0008C86989|nr:DUF4192 domain-containing protein [Streptomyces sp. yr375]SER97179.1 protein of unknown function [Streptomyces sp. yr375]